MENNFFNKEAITPFDFGVHYGIPDEQYHSIKAVSNSLMKNVQQSMAHFKAAFDGAAKEQTPAMRTGWLLHLAILQPTVFKEKIFIHTKTKTNATKAFEQDVLDNPDKVVLLQKDIELVTNMANAILENKIAKAAITGGQTEVTVFAKCPLTGLVMKGRADFEGEDYLLDYKTTENASPNVFQKNARGYWYHVQAAHYLELFKLAGKPKKYFMVLAQEKSPPYASAVYVYNSAAIEKGLELRQHALKEIANCAETGVWPGYSDGVVDLGLDSWGFEEKLEGMI